jgi:hypothetical protein
MGPVGRPLDLDAERLRDLLRERRPGPFGIELERTGDEMRGVDVAEQDVGVGDRGRLTAQVVADRAWKSASALRAGLQRAAGVDPNMRAAAGPDLGEVDGRNFQRISSPVSSREPIMIPAPTAYSWARAISPSSTMEALAVVPPMSNVMIFVRSFARASACAPTRRRPDRIR